MTKRKLADGSDDTSPEPIEASTASKSTSGQIDESRTTPENSPNEDKGLMGLSVEQQLVQYEQLYLAHYLGLIPNKGSGDYTASNAVAVARAAVKARMA